MREFEADAIRYKENLKLIRKNLGIPIFQDQVHDPWESSRRAKKTIRQYASLSIGTYFQNRGEKAKEEMDRIVKEEPHRKNLPITPVDLSLSTCLAMSKRLERNVMLKIGFDSVEREERPFYIGILDIVSPVG